jgi:hypothetical protein
VSHVIELFVFPVHGQKVAATRQMLEAAEVPVAEGQDFKEAVCDFFAGEGKWESVTLKENWTGRDDQQIKQALRKWDNLNRQWVVDELLYPQILVSKAVTEWTFFEGCAVSADQFLALPVGVSDVLFAEVQRCLYPSFLSAEVFTTPRQTE